MANTITAAEFVPSDYDVLDGIDINLVNDALAVLEAMGVLEDTETCAYAVAKMVNRIVEGRERTAEAARIAALQTPEQKAAVAKSRAVKSFNIYQYVKRRK